MSLKRRIKYNKLSFQRTFHNSTSKKVYLSGGFGCGKTYSLVMKMLQLAARNRGNPGGLLCPDLKMFRRDVEPTVREICNKHNIKYQFNGQFYYYLFPEIGSKIYIFHDQDKGRSIRGPNLGFMCINEVSLCSKESYDAALSRVRIKDAPFRQIAMSGTPEQFNWVYEHFVENPREDTEFIYGNVKENKYIADDYVKTLEESYDKLMAEAYIEGKFVNLTGKRAAWAFDRRKHCTTDLVQNKNFEVWVTIDFNVDPMSAVLWNRLPISESKLLAAFDEICISGSSNTYELAEEIKRRVGTDWVTLYPDPAGKARSTKTRGITDITILKQAGFENIKFKSRIPSVRDCCNSLNNLFDKDNIIINSKTCKNFVADLEQCKIKSGTFEIDKSNPKRSHWFDGAKNMADYEFPIKTKLLHRSQKR